MRSTTLLLVGIFSFLAGLLLALGVAFITNTPSEREQALESQLATQNSEAITSVTKLERANEYLRATNRILEEKLASSLNANQQKDLPDDEKTIAKMSPPQKTEPTIPANVKKYLEENHSNFVKYKKKFGKEAEPTRFMQKFVPNSRSPSGKTYVGQIGTLPPISIFQILGPQEMLCIMRYPLHRQLNNDMPFIVRGVSTHGMVDGLFIELKEAFEVTGTKTYTTLVGGTNTTFVLEAIDFTPYFNSVLPITN